MNASQTSQPSTSNLNTAASNVASLSTRHQHRERDFGVGYGNSSGYATTRKYASNWATPHFKCA